MVDSDSDDSEDTITFETETNLADDLENVANSDVPPLRNQNLTQQKNLFLRLRTL